MKRENPKHQTISIQDEPSLYETVNKEYENKNPVSRLVYLAKIVQPEQPEKTKKKEQQQAPKPDIIPKFIADLEECLNTFDTQTNVMLIFVGAIYAFVGIENSTSNITKLIRYLKKGSKMTENAYIISFNEECPCSQFPIWYKYEGEVYEKESQIYKDMTPAEKGWALYDNFFCNLGRNLKGLIRTKEDYKQHDKEVKDEEVKFVKYLPSMNEINVFASEEYPSLDDFISLYLNEMEVDFDDDVVYPYYWPINV